MMGLTVMFPSKPSDVKRIRRAMADGNLDSVRGITYSINHAEHVLYVSFDPSVPAWEYDYADAPHPVARYVRREVA